MEKKLRKEENYGEKQTKLIINIIQVMKNFIKIKDTRLRNNTIKRYAPIDENSIVVYYSASRYKIDKEVFRFIDKKERDVYINILDELL